MNYQDFMNIILPVFMVVVTLLLSIVAFFLKATHMDFKKLVVDFHAFVNKTSDGYARMDERQKSFVSILDSHEKRLDEHDRDIDKIKAKTYAGRA